MRPRPTISAALLAVAAAACGPQLPTSDGGAAAPASSDAPGAAEIDAGIAEQEALLAGGTVDENDYAAAVKRLEKCLRTRGIDLDNNGWDPVDQLRMDLWFDGKGIPDDAVADIGDACFTAHLEKVENRYSEDHEPRMADDLMSYARECMSDAGITTTGDEKDLAALVAAAEPDDEETVTDCVVAGAGELYPDTTVLVSW
ncbi:hypothetical protein CDO52_08455 [Nocardiopsis gilva YIM 90087]|uniref:Lipoprotein n=1 Tax=Nocardiopsis gilva YIM 90087 TaxID=1235441 RepID=A0A223S3W6_9ACTN|nr:hypothetical protein [Nocardiopsis gilva]ASU82808.1 hypothetical protein CDO52_08455 [Nocardiopsis gilva YIM 90087]